MTRWDLIGTGSLGLVSGLLIGWMHRPLAYETIVKQRHTIHHEIVGDHVLDVDETAYEETVRPYDPRPYTPPNLFGNYMDEKLGVAE